jgi:HlyD family secretion protein
VIIMAMPRGRLMLWMSGLAIAGVIAWAFRTPAVPVDLASIGRGDLRVTIDEEGMTRVRERYVVSAPVAGRLQRISLEAGDPVDANTTVLATFLPATPTPLDPRVRAETEARLKSARATREQASVAQQRARDEAAFSRNELKRYREIAKFGGTTDEHLAALDLEVRTRDAQLRAADLAVQAAEHELEAVGAVLRQFAGPSSSHHASAIVLRSPISGVVLRIHQESETLVAAGTPSSRSATRGSSKSSRTCSQPMR